MIAEPIALYIHWPFCLSRCPYCDFNAHVREVIPQRRFRDALRRELAWEAERLGRRVLGSIFFGGGTPSTMEPETVARLLEDARRLFDFQNDLEITLEANPTSIETSRLAALRDAGVNRISIGVQSLEPEPLAALGRQHSTGAGDRGAGDRAAIVSFVIVRSDLCAAGTKHRRVARPNCAARWTWWRIICRSIN